ncbi:hypothetical protein [Kitasatospora sp. NPDC059327]|uniref:hypothetical protein n=1 Tax=Kitasatospora sp. NPDC059327 TaxID=3346803 RepID=UPI0036A19109
MNLTQSRSRTAVSRARKVNAPGATNSRWLRVTRVSIASYPAVSTTVSSKPDAVARSRICAGGRRRWTPPAAQTRSIAGRRRAGSDSVHRAM